MVQKLTRLMFHIKVELLINFDTFKGEHIFGPNWAQLAILDDNLPIPHLFGSSRVFTYYSMVDSTSNKGCASNFFEYLIILEEFAPVCLFLNICFYILKSYNVLSKILSVPRN